jgi:hypothetical protein
VLFHDRLSSALHINFVDFVFAKFSANISSCFQYEQLNEGSEEKRRVLREIKETVVHRKHLDSSVDFIAKLLFGFENGPSMLEAPRSSGQPLVDDWDCLKRMVSVILVPYFNPLEFLMLLLNPRSFCFSMLELTL